MGTSQQIPINSGDVVFEGDVSFEGGINYGNAVIVEILVEQNNLLIPDIENAYLIHLEPQGAQTVHGIIAPDPKKTQKIEVFNTGTGNLSLKNNSGLAIAENRMLLGANKTIQVDEGVSFVYDIIDNRWRSTSINI